MGEKLSVCRDKISSIIEPKEIDPEEDDSGIDDREVEDEVKGWSSTVEIVEKETQYFQEILLEYLQYLRKSKFPVKKMVLKYLNP